MWIFEKNVRGDKTLQYDKMRPHVMLCQETRTLFNAFLCTLDVTTLTVIKRLCQYEVRVLARNEGWVRVQVLRTGEDVECREMGEEWVG